MFSRDLDRRVQDAVARYEAPEVAVYQAKIREGLMGVDAAALMYSNAATRSGQMWQHALTEAQTYGAPPEFLLPFAIAYRNRALRTAEAFDNYGL